MKLNREYQKRILDTLATAFPCILTREQYAELASDVEEEVFAANVRYLEMHELIQPGSIQVAMDGSFVINLGKLQITHRGLDFLADDGGLSAVLGVLTVKLHADTVRDLIEAKVQGSDMPDSDKKRFIDQLRALPSEGLKHLTTRLIDAALDNLPAALPLLRAHIGF